MSKYYPQWVNYSKKLFCEFGICLDRRLTWKDHVKSKRTQVDNKLKNMYWLLGRKSKLSLENKILIYEIILKTVWTYGIQLWGTTSDLNIEILQRLQSKTLMVFSFLQRKCHPLTRCINKIADQPCYNVIFLFEKNITQIFEKGMHCVYCLI